MQIGSVYGAGDQCKQNRLIYLTGISSTGAAPPYFITLNLIVRSNSVSNWVYQNVFEYFGISECGLRIGTILRNYY